LVSTPQSLGLVLVSTPTGLSLDLISVSRQQHYCKEAIKYKYQAA